MELNYLNLFKFYCIFSVLGPMQLWGRGQIEANREAKYCPCSPRMDLIAYSKREPANNFLKKIFQEQIF